MLAATQARGPSGWFDRSAASQTRATAVAGDEHRLDDVLHEGTRYRRLRTRTGAWNTNTAAPLPNGCRSDAHVGDPRWPTASYNDTAKTER